MAEVTVVRPGQRLQTFDRLEPEPRVCANVCYVARARHPDRIRRHPFFVTIVAEVMSYHRSSVV